MELPGKLAPIVKLCDFRLIDGYGHSRASRTWRGNSSANCWEFMVQGLPTNMHRVARCPARTACSLWIQATAFFLAGLGGKETTLRPDCRAFAPKSSAILRRSKLNRAACFYRAALTSSTMGSLNMIKPRSTVRACRSQGNGTLAIQLLLQSAGGEKHWQDACNSM